MAKKSSDNGLRIHDYREHLKTISSGLEEMAKAAGRSNYTINQLLRECYNLVNVDCRTLKQWNRKKRLIRNGQHAYLFWAKDMKSAKEIKDNSILLFLFAEEQTKKMGE